jgi:hypothetical protein
MNQDDVHEIKFYPRLALDRMLRARGTPAEEPEAPVEWGYPRQESLTVRELLSLAEGDDLEARIRAAHHADCHDTVRRDIALHVLRELSTAEGDAWEEVYELAFHFLEDFLRLDPDPELLRAAHRILDVDDVGYGSLRAEIARNAACPDDVYLALLDDQEVWTDEFPFDQVWHSILVNPRQPPEGAGGKLQERLLEAAEWDSDAIRRLAARSPHADAEVLLHLLTAGEPYDGISDATLLAVRHHPNLPNQVVVLAAALAEGPPEWRRLLAAGLDAEDAWAFELMAQDKDDSVRAAIAGHDEAPPAILAMLAIDESIQVRRAVRSNPASTEAMRASAALLGM